MRVYTRIPAIDRFLKKVEKTETCWLWRGALRGGYGKFWDGKNYIQAHWFLLDPRPQDGQGAYHRCDVHNCVRPAHIFVGYPADNTNDMVAKGRENWLVGAECHYAKLTEEQARLIKACPRRKGALMKMSIALAISDNTACEIRNGNRWRHLPPPSPEDFARAEAFLATLTLRL